MDAWTHSPTIMLIPTRPTFVNQSYYDDTKQQTDKTKAQTGLIV